jgi:hypothetical protein
MRKPIVLHQTDGRKAAFNPEHIVMVTPGRVVSLEASSAERQTRDEGTYVVDVGSGGTFVSETYEQVMELWLGALAVGG